MFLERVCCARSDDFFFENSGAATVALSSNDRKTGAAMEISLEIKAWHVLCCLHDLWCSHSFHDNGHNKMASYGMEV